MTIGEDFMGTCLAWRHDAMPGEGWFFGMVCAFGEALRAREELFTAQASVR